MAKLEPAGSAKAVCIDDLPPNKDMPAAGMEEKLGIILWQRSRTARKFRFCGQNDLFPKWQLFKLAQIRVNGPTNLDGGAKISGGQTPDVNESELTNDFAIVRPIDAARPDSDIGALQNFCFSRLISESNGCGDPQTDCRNCEHPRESGQRERVIRYPPLYQLLLAFFVGCCAAGAIGAYCLRG